MSEKDYRDFSRVGNLIIGFSIESIEFCDWKIERSIRSQKRLNHSSRSLKKTRCDSLMVDLFHRSTRTNWSPRSLKRSKIEDGSDSIFRHKKGENCPKHMKNTFFEQIACFLRVIQSFWSFSKIDESDSNFFRDWQEQFNLFQRSTRAIWSRLIFFKDQKIKFQTLDISKSSQYCSVRSVKSSVGISEEINKSVGCVVNSQGISAWVQEVSAD